MRRSRSPIGEVVVVGALLAAGACAVAFVALYIFDEFNTQLLGLSLGLALAFGALPGGRAALPPRQAP